jgi:hypothetical protein
MKKWLAATQRLANVRFKRNPQKLAQRDIKTPPYDFFRNVERGDVCF